jgi:HK97 family phage major capsid protein
MYPMPGTLDILRSRWQESVDQLTALNDRATNEDRELTEGENANAQMLRSRVTSFGERIAAQAALEGSIASTNDLVRNLPVHVPSQVITPDAVMQPGEHEALIRSFWPTAGDYMHDVIHSHQGDYEARERIARAIQNEITSDVPGIVPTPIIGDIINIINASRPIVTALRSYAMPQYGSSFTRPKVVQHTQVGEQTAQKTELPSRKFTVNPINVNKMTLGGAIDVAFQVIDWTSPSALNAISNDLADQYAIQTESVAASLMTAAGTANVANAITTVTPLTAAKVTAALASAAAKVYAGSKTFPDMILASPDMWAMLAGTSDTTGRPLMMAGSPQNSQGNLVLTAATGSILGLPIVVSPALPTGSLYVVASKFAEVYEDRKGALRVVEPKLLGWEIAYYGYFAGLVTENTAVVQVILTP